MHGFREFDPGLLYFRALSFQWTPTSKVYSFGALTQSEGEHFQTPFLGRTPQEMGSEIQVCVQFYWESSWERF